VVVIVIILQFKMDAFYFWNEPFPYIFDLPKEFLQV
jgi:hypothetical protein